MHGGLAADALASFLGFSGGVGRQVGKPRLAPDDPPSPAPHGGAFFDLRPTVWRRNYGQTEEHMKKRNKSGSLSKVKKTAKSALRKTGSKTQARRKEGGRRDWDGLNGNGSRGAKRGRESVQPGGVMGRTSDTATGLPFLALTAKPQW